MDTHDCDANASCTNTVGSWTCACNTGYSGTGTSCSDVNECTAGTHDCDANADCTNTAGGYSCSCKSGWSGDGKSCTQPTTCHGLGAGTQYIKPNGGYGRVKVTCDGNGGLSIPMDKREEFYDKHKMTDGKGASKQCEDPGND